MGAAVNDDLDSVDEKGYANGHVKSDTAEVSYVVSQDHIYKKRPRRVICIGAGIVGIAAAYKYQQRLSNISFSIYEKNHDVGGTWLENRYPGCACDITCPWIYIFLGRKPRWVPIVCLSNATSQHCY
jgi:heterodisulfide reductase subunit A-like polyferredoxin